MSERAKVKQVMIGGKWATILSREDFQHYQSRGMATRILPLSAFAPQSGNVEGPTSLPSSRTANGTV